jgi:N-formylglutamate amidohydrolase
MIEVNKCLYINEQTLEKTDGFDQLKADIQSLYEKLLYYGNSSASNPPAAL